MTLFVAAVINVLLLTAALIYWIRTGETFFSFGFFCLLISLFFICVFGITINHDERPVLRDISYGSFGLFIIMTVVIIAILSEGDILETADFDFDFGKGKKKGKVK